MQMLKRRWRDRAECKRGGTGFVCQQRELKDLERSILMDSVTSNSSLFSRLHCAVLAVSAAHPQPTGWAVKPTRRRRAVWPSMVKGLCSSPERRYGVSSICTVHGISPAQEPRAWHETPNFSSTREHCHIKSTFADDSANFLP